MSGALGIILSLSHPAQAQSSPSLETTVENLIAGLVAGDLEAARSAATKIEAQIESGERLDDLSPGQILGTAAEVLQSLGDVEGGITYFEKAAAVAAANGNDHVRLEALFLSAHAVLQTERYAEAAIKARSVADLFLEVMGQSAKPVRDLRLLEGLALSLDGQEDGAVAVLAPLHDTNIAIGGNDSPDATVSGLALGQALYNTGRAAEAVPILEDAARGAAKNGGTNHPSTFAAEMELGIALRDSGDLSKAEVVLADTHQRASEFLPPSDTGLMRIKSELARTYKAMGKYWAFRQLNEEVMRSEISGTASPERQLAALFAFAEQAQAELDYEVYEQALRAIIALVEANPELPPARGAEAMGTLGEHLYQIGRDDQVEALLTRARDALLALSGPDAPETLSVLATISRIRRDDAANADRLRMIGRRPLFATGKPNDDAVTVEDLEIYRKLAVNPNEGFSEVDRLAAKFNYAELLRVAGQFEKALALVDEQLSDGQAATGSSSLEQDAFGVSQGYSLKRLRGDILVGMERYNEAVQTFSDGMDDILNFLRWSAPLTALGNTELVQTAGRVFGERFAKTAWEAAGKEGAPEETVLRGLAFEAVQVAGFNAASRAISRSNARFAAADPALQAQISRWESLAFDRVATSVSSKASTLERRDAALELATVEAEIETAIPGFFESHVPAPIPLETVQAALGEEDALILLLPPGTLDLDTHRDYGIVFALTRKTSSWARLDMPREDLLLTIARLHLALDPADRTERVMAALRAPLAPDGSAAPLKAPMPEFDFHNASRLYEAFFGAPEIEAVIGPKPNWLIVPQGVAMSAPFATLVSSQPPADLRGLAALRAASWLGHKRAFSVLPSVSALQGLKARPSAVSGPETLAYLGVGDPVFQGAEDAPIQTADAVFRNATGAGNSLSTLPRLPGTRREVEVLATLFAEGNRRTLLGAEAREGNIRALDAEGVLSGAQILHFATHGLVSGAFEGLGEPALALSPSLSATSSDDDGLLTASEAARLNLDVEWVILSACDTAEGIALGGDGLGGLAQGFLHAGARSLMVSHWRVDDTAAARLTTDTVALTRNGTGKAEALRQAMKRLADDTSRDGAHLPNAHPSVWAPFFLIGDVGS